MSIEEQARLASTELRTSVAHAVSPEGARGELSRRLRGRQVEHGVLAVLCIAAVAVFAVLLVGPAADTTLPSTIPTVNPTASPASDCLFSSSCTDGVYRAALAVPTTFSTGAILSVMSDTASVLDLSDPMIDVGLTVVANPRETASDGSPLGDPSSAAPSPADLVAWLQGRPDLDVSEPIHGRVGGRDALQVDVMASGAETYDPGCGGQDGCVPLLGVESQAGELVRVGLVHGESVRLSLIEVPDEGTVAVLVRDRTAYGAAPTYAATRLDQVVASLSFGG